MTKLRIGVVGLGGIAQKAYLPVLSHEENWTLVGGFSPNQQRPSQFVTATVCAVSQGWTNWRHSVTPCLYTAAPPRILMWSASCYSRAFTCMSTNPWRQNWIRPSV